MARNSNSKNQAKKPERKFKEQGQGNVVATAPEIKSKADECTKSGRKCKNWGKKNGGTCSKFGRLCSETRV